MAATATARATADAEPELRTSPLVVLGGAGDLPAARHVFGAPPADVPLNVTPPAPRLVARTYYVNGIRTGCGTDKDFFGQEKNTGIEISNSRHRAFGIVGLIIFDTQTVWTAPHYQTDCSLRGYLH